MTAHAAYEAARQQAREKAGPREDRGLPRHPDGSGLADCPICECSGEVACPAQLGDDPQDERLARCSLCAGTGYLGDGHRDPILDLRRLRLMRRYNVFDRIAYDSTRIRASRPTLHTLAQHESDLGVVNAYRDMLAAQTRIAA